MTESGVDDRTGGRLRSQPSVLGFDFDGAWRAGGAQQEARDMVAEADHALLDLLARAGKGWLPSRLGGRAAGRRGPGGRGPPPPPPPARGGGEGGGAGAGGGGARRGGAARAGG